MSSRPTFRTDRRLLTHTFLSLLLLSLLPSSLHAARGAGSGGKMEVLPSQKAAPAAVFLDAQGTEEDLRRQLRHKTGVVELGADLQQTRFSVAPVGTFGFAPQQGLGLALVSQSPDMLLERTAPAANAYVTDFVKKNCSFISLLKSSLPFVESTCKSTLFMSE